MNVKQWGRVVLVLATSCLSIAARAGTVYVDAALAGSGNSGTNWANAYTNLQTALGAATSGDEIWVAQGTYYPAEAGSETVSFELASGVGLYGGFTNGMALLSERDWNAYPAVLSGDIDRDGVRDDENTDQVVDVANGVNDWVLDGFTITMGDGVSGAGIDVGSHENGTIANCRIVNNETTGGGALSVAAVGSFATDLTVTNCVLAQNLSENSGCAIRVVYGGYFRIVDSRIYDNHILTVKSATSMYIQRSRTNLIENCVFAANTATNYATAGIHFEGHASIPIYTALVANCVFSGNKAAKYGCVLADNGAGISNVVVRGCTFCGNTGEGSGSGDGVMRLRVDGGNLSIRNCLVAGNRAEGHAGIGWHPSTASPKQIENCVFAYNESGSRGTVYLGSASNSIANSIFWGNTAGLGSDAIENRGGNQLVRYTDIEGGWDGSGVYNASGSAIIDGGGNTNTLPLFGGGPSGTWTADATYDSAIGQSALKDAAAVWTVNRWADTLINPDTSQVLQYYVASNSTDTLYVWGDLSAVAAGGDAYQGYDYHLKSQYGRWTALGWVQDATNSPLINAGDPSSDASREPLGREIRINMGVYGNTAQASKSLPPPCGTLVMVR